MMPNAFPQPVTSRNRRTSLQGHIRAPLTGGQPGRVGNVAAETTNQHKRLSAFRALSAAPVGWAA